MPRDGSPRTLITRLSHIGDCILTLPVLNALRARHPASQTTRTMEGDGGRWKTMNPYSLLKSLRRWAPDAKSWG